MDLKIYGLNKIDSNLYDQIIIKELGIDDFVVEVLGPEEVSSSDKISKLLNGLSIDDKLLTIVQKYLDVSRINYVTKLPPLIIGNHKESIVYNQDGKRLMLKIYNPKFKKMADLVLDKYLNDRYDYFFGENVSNLKLDYSVDSFGYVICDDNVNFTLKTDLNHNLLKYELLFIKDFLYNKFFQIGEDVTVQIMDYLVFGAHGRRIEKKYVVECGDFKMEFPQCFTFSTILGIVNDYINEFNVVKNKRHKGI